MDSRSVVITANNFIRENNLLLLKEYYESLKIPSKTEIEVYGEVAPPIKRLDLAFIFTKLFTNACLYNRYQIVCWLMDIYQGFDDISKVGMKSTFNYVRHLTRTKKYYKLHKYLVNLKLF